MLSVSGHAVLYEECLSPEESHILVGSGEEYALFSAPRHLQGSVRMVVGLGIREWSTRVLLAALPRARARLAENERMACSKTSCARLVLLCSTHVLLTCIAHVTLQRLCAGTDIKRSSVA